MFGYSYGFMPKEDGVYKNLKKSMDEVDGEIRRRKSDD